MRADMRLCELIDARSDDAALESLIAAGRAAVDMATLRFTHGGALDDDDVAWLGLLLVNVAGARLRVGAGRRRPAAQRRGVDRRRAPGRPGSGGGPATLLAFAAWRNGDGAVASIALDRAVACRSALPDGAGS